MKKLKVVSLFSGIGAFEKGLNNSNVLYELLNYCEIEPHASECYAKIHTTSEDKNLWDVTKVNAKEHNLEDVDLITHGSPCQDFSSAGKQKGGEEGSGTRSSLLWETIRIVKESNPKYVIWENVKNATTGKHKMVFEKYLNTLDDMGYNNYVPDKYVLNAKDYGIPQARERVFVVSIRKDVDSGEFKFPKPIHLTKDLMDFADFRECDDITDNFYKRYLEIKNPNATYEEFVEYIDSLPIRKGIGTKVMGLYDFNEMDTITTCDGITGTLTCRNVQNYNKKFWYNKRLYKPSPRMCFRLMGFSDEDFEKVKNVGTDSKLWDRAGNSIVVNVVTEIFKVLLEEYIENK